MNINDELPRFGIPVDIRVSRGRLRCVPPYADQELEFDSIEGELIGIEQIKWHGFPYWSLILQDGINTYRLLFFLKSGTFVVLLRHLLYRTVKWLSIMIGMKEGTVQMIVEGDNVRLNPVNITLPTVKHHYERTGGKIREWHDYQERLEAVQTIVNGLRFTLVR